jgi:hypothetical protein
MKDLKQQNKSESVTVRLSKVEAESLQNEANNELLSISALVRRKLFFNRLKATA